MPQAGMFTKRTKLTAALLAAALFFLAAWNLLLRKQPPPIAYPDPNGYDTLLIAASLIGSNSSEDLRLSASELREAQTNNARGIQIAREGLKQESRKRISQSMILSGAQLENLAKIKSLATAFAIEGRLAELENDFDCAATNYLDQIRVAHNSSRGGLLVDRLLSIASERMALRYIDAIKAKLENPSKIADALEEIRRNEEPIQETIQTERAWASRVGGWRTPVLRIFRPNMLKGPEASFEKKATELHAERDQLIKDLRANRPPPPPARDPSAP